MAEARTGLAAGGADAVSGGRACEPPLALPSITFYPRLLRQFTAGAAKNLTKRNSATFGPNRRPISCRSSSRCLRRSGPGISTIQPPQPPRSFRVGPIGGHRSFPVRWPGKPQNYDRLSAGLFFAHRGPAKARIGYPETPGSIMAAPMIADGAPSSATDCSRMAQPRPSCAFKTERGRDSVTAVPDHMPMVSTLLTLWR